MAININLLSIDVDQKLHAWFKYGDMLIGLADKVDIFRQSFRGILSQEQRNQLRESAKKIRAKAVDVSTKIGTEFLEEFEAESPQLKQAVSQIDQLLNDIINTRAIISGLRDILALITNILAFAA